MLLDIDQRAVCDEHIGSPYPVRCAACDEAARDNARIIHQAHKLGECVEHPGYPSSERWPCERCQRESAS